MPTDTRSKHPSPSNPFGVSLRQADERTTVVTLEGDLDLARAPKMKWALMDAADAGCLQLVVDLTEVGFMDSTALGVIVGVRRSLPAGAGLAIACASPRVLNIFELSGLDGSFSIFPTLEEALGHVRGHPAAAG